MKLFEEIPYLENKHLILKKTEENDFSSFLEILRIAEQKKELPSGLIKTDVPELYRISMEKHKSLFLGIYGKENPEKLLGLTEFYHYDPNWNKVSLAIFLKEEYIGKKYEEHAIRLATDYLLENTDIRRITAHISSENEILCQNFEKQGYRLRKQRFAEEWGYPEKVPVNKYISDKFENDSYAVIGNGPKPMVILPGVALKSTLGAADVIAETFSAFKDYTIYLMDDRKCVDEGYTLRTRAGDVASLMKTLKIKHACVYGASMGGMVGQFLALDHPELVDKLVLAATTSRLNDKSKAVFTRWISLCEQNRLEELNRKMIEEIFSETTVAQYGELLEKNMGIVSEEEQAKFCVLCRAIMNYDCYDELDKIRSRVQVVSAEGDKIFGCEDSQKIADKLQCPIWEYGPEYGHAVYDEAADFKDRMKKFFDE